MSLKKDKEYMVGLLLELVKLPKETEWLEFKLNCASEYEEIGEYISALSNSAALCGKLSAYLIWGVDDNNHNIVGTNFKPSAIKKGNEELENWLLRLIDPKINFNFYEINIEDKLISIMEIMAATERPIQFKNVEYIRIGSYKKKLKDNPQKEKELWKIFDSKPFESLVALNNLADDEVISVIDYPSYFDLLGLPLPSNKREILQSFKAEGMIVKNDASRWDVTNLGAILFAKNLSDFPFLLRKPIRVILYKDNSRIETVKEQVGTKGYAAGFEGLIDFVNGLLPSNEVIEQALRKNVTMYPELAIRELVANAIIHQDFFITGRSVTIEIFMDRIEITNPGAPLININRLLDTPPRSRNERLASFMRRIGVCEERGSGIDRVVFQTEFYQLPAPLFETVEDNTIAVLFAHKPLGKMSKKERIRACYLHSCLKYVNRENMSNATLRERFGVESKNSAKISRYIKEAIDSGEIALLEKDAPPKMRKYIPFWAAEVN
ncbi:Predicted transcriptional regulator containing an HTH domain and an uncharacterized domain shared with the mammalian protein Schlafen [uncultured Gammaproteobacteria bacterium]|nr:Predicted transcriptional regulator containing an HTH domain and an uncharacterized domain shared with the mammalian protein Schlafen [uncultured Gammaproteobacteria bacterium]